MWRDTARDFIDVPILMFPLYAPLSRTMVEHLVLLEYQPYRRAVVSSWPAREKVWQRIVERVEKAREDVCGYMDIFYRDDIIEAKEEGRERIFPDSNWILDQLAAYPPNIRLTEKALEKWQSKNILRKEYPGSSLWRLDDVAALLIMRICNTTHQKGWLPESIPPDEPRWWAFGKSVPDAPTQSIPIPLAGGDSSPLFLWTPRIGALWAGYWQRLHGVSVRWSRHFNDANELAVWHTMYAQEIQKVVLHGAETATSELHFAQDGMLTTRPAVQAVIRASIEQILRDVQESMLREAEQLILEEQARLVSKER